MCIRQQRLHVKSNIECFVKQNCFLLKTVVFLLKTIRMNSDLQQIPISISY